MVDRYVGAAGKSISVPSRQDADLYVTSKIEYPFNLVLYL